MNQIIAIAQIVVAAIIIVLILLQERSSGFSGALGGGSEGGFYQTRRGVEKMIFIATIVLTAAFLCLSIANLII